jgi:carboxymethylenebutenolidase
MLPTEPDGYLARPASGMGQPVLVLHAWWGLNDTIKALCDRLAAEGYVALAPDLYHGHVADTIPGAEALLETVDGNSQQVIDDVAAAANYLYQFTGEPARGLAVIGFSMGAYYALALSAAAPEIVRAVVVFYGNGEADFSRARAAYLGHFAGNDPYEPAEGVAELEAALRAAGREVTIHTYPDTGHWFFEPDRADAYDAKAAELAWQRTLAFLKK